MSPAFGESGLLPAFSEVVSLLMFCHFLCFRVAIFHCMLASGCFLRRLCHILCERKLRLFRSRFPILSRFSIIFFQLSRHMDSASLGKSVPNITFNPQTPDGVYKPPLVYCRMGFINTSPFPALHLSRNVAKVFESLKISDQRMAKLY